MNRITSPACVATLLLVLVPAARASTPSPLASALFPFPGATRHPASAASAGFALADRWLADEPFDNPATAPWRGASLSGVLLHVSRQDLRALNRNFDETPAFFDGAGIALGMPLGRFALDLYAFQPVLQQESNAFSRGRGTPDPSNPPATIQAEASVRELCAGAGVATGVGLVRLGAAVEWTRRDDRYTVIETGGSPTAGTRQLDITGDVIGFQLGARVEQGRLALGAGLRRQPALSVDAPLTETLLTGTTDTTLAAEREAGWEGGVSARVAASPAFAVRAALGGRSARAWNGFDLAAGRAWSWTLALEYHDARDPWTLRFGFGQEREADVPEPRADDLALGFGWRFAGATVDLGLMHRTLARSDTPHSFDDRIVLTASTRH